jgi:syndecan 4
MNGECDYTKGKCECFVGFSGEKCNKKVCINDCSNKGKCINGECICLEEFTGISCEHSI